MPLYEFQCQECGLRAEKLYRRITDVKEIPCSECGGAAKKQMSAVNHTFAHQPVGGPRPQNTGVHSIDYNADRVIGRDAEARWKVVEERQKHKRDVLRQEHKAGRAAGMEHLTRTQADGTGYRTVTESERKVINERRTAAFEVGRQTGKKDPKKSE